MSEAEQVAAAPAAAAPQGTTPSLSVEGVRQVHLLCLVASDGTPVTSQLQSDLRERLRRLATRGAATPVAIAELGDPAVLDPNAMTLLLHGKVERIGGADVLALSLRSFRNGGTATATLFGPAPRAVALADVQAVDRAIDEALAHVLPWRSAPDGPRPIHPV